MIEEKARVERLEKDLAWVSPLIKQSCQSCSKSGGCSSMMWRWFCRRDHSFSVKNTLDVHPGDCVIIGVNEQALMQGSLMLYLLPIILLIGFAALGQQVDAWMATNGEWFAILFGGIGLLTGYYCARLFDMATSKNARFQPRLIKRINPTH